METKQTAVEAIIERAKKYPSKEVRECIFSHIIKEVESLKMEKEQMKDAFVACWESNVPDGIECKLDAEQYYNETYGKQDKQTN